MEETEKTIEERAAEQGHVPREEWKGDPEKWVSAEEFVRRGEEIIPIMKEQIGRLRSDLEIALKANTSELKKVRAEAAKQAYEKATAEYEEKLAVLREQELAAVESGDVRAYEDAKKKVEKLAKPEKPDVNAGNEHGDSPNIEFEEWKTTNKWMDEDDVMAAAAAHIARKIQHTEGLPDGKRLYDRVAEEIKKQFPHKFSNPRRSEKTGVEGASPVGGGTGGGKTFSDLPVTAKKQYERLAAQFKAKGRSLTKEAYAQSYYED